MNGLEIGLDVLWGIEQDRCEFGLPMGKKKVDTDLDSQWLIRRFLYLVEKFTGLKRSDSEKLAENYIDTELERDCHIRTRDRLDYSKGNLKRKTWIYIAKG